MNAVFDLDDTISIHKNRDFANAEPIDKTIRKIRDLKRDGWTITIYTARGQNSCKGDLKLIEERNRTQIETWLAEHDVPYDKIVFGKPLGDLYVDDKGISLEAFLSSPYEKLTGNSGSKIYRIGDTVIKHCKDAAQQAGWYKEARRYGIYVPEVRSVVLDSITMQYIEGQSGAERILSESDIYRLVSYIMAFSIKRDGYIFDTDALIERAKDHLRSTNQTYDFTKLFNGLSACKRESAANASFCHGDLSLSNTIFNDRGIYLIDPIVNNNYSSFMMDFAKLRFSLDGGEKFLHGEEAINTQSSLRTLDGILTDLNSIGWTIRAYEAIYWIRLLKYTGDIAYREQIIAKARELEDGL